jgi:DNA-binding NarL/FixJ family response regulator
VADTHLFIFSPHALQCEAWRALLSNQPGILISGTLTEPSQITTHMRPEQASTILIDLSTPLAELAHRFRTLAPGCGLLFLVPSYELSIVLPLLRAGATGFISRDASLGDLARAIIAAGRGEIVLPPEIAVQSLMALAQGQPFEQGMVATLASLAPLSERETEVLRLLAQGFTNKDIAQALILSVRTVEAHLRGIFAKLGVSSRTEAALWAVQHGYSDQKFR